ncbi:MAG: outer membrane protein [Flavobacteriales bacterium]|jgi:outer membrane protein
MLRILFLYTAFFRLLIILCMFVSRTTLACSEDETCIEKNSWQLGFAFGVGVKTNPLVDGDNIPLVILPDIAWYAEKAYFDNGELGYQWLSQPTFAFETFIQLDRESAFFSFLHPANILISTENAASNSTNVSALPDLSVSPDENIQNNQRSLSIDDIVSRKWAINGGIRGHYFLSNGEWQLTLQQDISNIHQGQQVGLEYSHRWLWHDFRLGLRVGTDWKSADLIDYYYGVSQRDTSLSRFYFQGKSGWQTYMSINAQKPINENWSWLANIGYRRLPNSLLSSPLIDQNNIRNVFLGVAYRF